MLKKLGKSIVILFVLAGVLLPAFSGGVKLFSSIALAQAPDPFAPGGPADQPDSNPLTPTEAAELQNQGVDVSGANILTPQDAINQSTFARPDTMPPCSLATIGGCLAQLIYYALFVPTSWVIWCAGRLLDFGVAYSIQSGSYSGTSFVTEGWKLVRDISNIFFILVLIYTGISIMLDLDNDAKKKISTVVIVAVMINFSLFFSKVIIDAGNIVAKTLYYNIQPKDKTGKDIDPTIIGSYSVKPLSAVLVDKYDPQQILLQVNSEDIGKENGALITGAVTNGKSDFGTGSFILVVLLAVALNIIGAYVFFVAAFLFIGRVIGLWFAMIFAPLAFISYTLPSKASGKLGSFGHDKWWSELISLSFMAPVFIFFMYLIILFLDTDFLNFKTSLVNTGGSLFLLMSVIIPFIFIAIMLLKAKKIAKDMSGEIAGQLVGFAEKAGGMLTGVGVGALTGGAALLGRNTIGKGFSSMANNEETKAKAAAGDRFAQAKLSLANMGSKWSFDARKAPGIDALAKNKELSNIKSPKWMGFNAQIPVLGRIDTKTEGGYAGKVDRNKKAELAKNEMFKMKGPEADAQNAKSKAWNAEYEKERNLAEQTARANGEIFNEINYKKLFEAGRITKSNGEQSTSSIPDATATNAKRTRNEADTIQYGKGYVDQRDSARSAHNQTIAAAIEHNQNPANQNNQIAVPRPFNEKDWREQNGIEARTTTRSEDETISALRKQAGEEAKEEKPLSASERIKAEKILENSNIELTKIEALLQTIATQNGIPADQVNQGHVNTRIDSIQTDLDTTVAQQITQFQTKLSAAAQAKTAHEVNLAKFQAEYNDALSRGDTAAQNLANSHITQTRAAIQQSNNDINTHTTGLVTKLADKKTKENEITKLKKVFDDKEKHEEIRTKKFQDLSR